MTCKAKYASIVTIKTPIAKNLHSMKTSVCDDWSLYNIALWGIIRLDKSAHIGVIIITNENRTALTQNARRQAPGTPPKRNASSTCREGTRPVVLGREFLRPAGSYPGQIRNAAPGSERRGADQHSGGQFRRLSSSLLQGAAGFCPRRPGRSHCPAARPPRRPQGDGRSSGLCGADSRPGPQGHDTGAVAENSKEILPSGAPQNLGTSFGGREKKTEQAVVAERESRRFAPAAILTEHYEALRGCVLDRKGSSGMRLGQGAFMARGMAAWMQVAGELIPLPRSAPVLSEKAAHVPRLVSNEVIQLMGEAVMTLVCGGSL